MSPVAALGSQPAVYQTGWALVGSVGHHPYPVRGLEFNYVVVGPFGVGDSSNPASPSGVSPRTSRPPTPPPLPGGSLGGQKFVLSGGTMYSIDYNVTITLGSPGHFGLSQVANSPFGLASRFCGACIVRTF